MKTEMRRGVGCLLGPAAALAALWLLFAMAAAASAGRAAVPEMQATEWGPVLVPVSAGTGPSAGGPGAELAPQVARIDFQKTVGTDAGTCAASKAVTVLTSTVVAYCYKVYNTGTVTVTHHFVTDTQLGLLYDNDYTLTPGAGVYFIVTHTVAATVVNTATWTASNPGPTDQVSDTDSAQVAVLFLHVWLPVVLK